MNSTPPSPPTSSSSSFPGFGAHGPSLPTPAQPSSASGPQPPSPIANPSNQGLGGRVTYHFFMHNKKLYKIEVTTDSKKANAPTELWKELENQLRRINDVSNNQLLQVGRNRNLILRDDTLHDTRNNEDFKPADCEAYENALEAVMNPPEPPQGNPAPSALPSPSLGTFSSVLSAPVPSAHPLTDSESDTDDKGDNPPLTPTLPLATKQAMKSAQQGALHSPPLPSGGKKARLNYKPPALNSSTATPKSTQTRRLDGGDRTTNATNSNTPTLAIPVDEGDDFDLGSLSHAGSRRPPKAQLTPTPSTQAHNFDALHSFSPTYDDSYDPKPPFRKKNCLGFNLCRRENAGKSTPAPAPPTTTKRLKTAKPSPPHEAPSTTKKTNTPTLAIPVDEGDNFDLGSLSHAGSIRPPEAQPTPTPSTQAHSLDTLYSVSPTDDSNDPKPPSRQKSCFGLNLCRRENAGRLTPDPAPKVTTKRLKTAKLLPLREAPSAAASTTKKTNVTSAKGRASVFFTDDTYPHLETTRRIIDADYILVEDSDDVPPPLA